METSTLNSCLGGKTVTNGLGGTGAVAMRSRSHFLKNPRFFFSIASTGREARYSLWTCLHASPPCWRQ